MHRAMKHRAMKRVGWFVAWFALLVGALPSAAHEVRPAYLELVERDGGAVDVLFKQPVGGAPGLVLEPRLPPNCQSQELGFEWVGASTLVRRWRAECGAGGLRGGRIEIDGLRATLTDVAVLVRLSDGSNVRALVRPEAPSLKISAASDRGLATYFRLGVDHLVFGFDHVLFVLSLLFFLTRLRPLVRAITAFTVAHSITLGLSALGWVHLPQAPVEAVIALSILLLSIEKLRGSEGTLTARHTWLVAFGFGLLHGFGFAGALGQIGLPREDLLAALLLFNLGVEAGQLGVVFVAALGAATLARLPLPGPIAYLLPRAALYGIGSLASCWLIDRTLGLL